jgi:hypothetical protein
VLEGYANVRWACSKCGGTSETWRGDPKVWRMVTVKGVLWAPDPPYTHGRKMFTLKKSSYGEDEDEEGESIDY